MARDAGLARVSSVTRWMMAGVAAVSGGLALLAASAFHGRALASTPAATATQTPATQSPGSSSAASVQAPAQAPVVPVQQAPVVVSGGS